MRELLKRIFLVRKCVGCRKILEYKNFNEAFCPDCRELYLGARMDICPECASEAERCRCMPPLLKKENAASLIKLFFYSKKKDSEPQNRLIYYLKRNKSRRVNAFVANELVLIIRNELSKLQIDEPPLIVGVPRARGAVNEHGFDQSEMLSKAVAERLFLEYYPYLKRRRGGKPQKSLTAGERRKNIKDLVYVLPSDVERIKGKTVVLIDDVVTTGATMSACAHVLRACGAKNLLCVAIASDIKM